MSSLAEVTLIARDVLNEALPDALEDIRSEDGADEEGAPALRVTGVLRNGAVVRGPAFASALTRLQRRLNAEGESRFAYLSLVATLDPADDES